MPYKIGKKTKTKGYPIMRFKDGKWQVVGHSKTKKLAKTSIEIRKRKEK